MARNIEIKARVEDPEALRSRVEKLAEDGAEAIEQEDVFFHSPNGRLKLRKTGAGAELIYYERVDTRQPAESQYLKTPVAEGAELEATLSVALGVRGTVRKRRRVYRVGRTRVHLDEVDGLGTFVELEVELGSAHSAGEGTAIAAGMMDRLGLHLNDLVGVAYIDLLEALPGDEEE